MGDAVIEKFPRDVMKWSFQNIFSTLPKKTTSYCYKLMFFSLGYLSLMSFWDFGCEKRFNARNVFVKHVFEANFFNIQNNSILSNLRQRLSIVIIKRTNFDRNNRTDQNQQLGRKNSHDAALKKTTVDEVDKLLWKHQNGYWLLMKWNFWTLSFGITKAPKEKVCKW